ncbi:GntR family transcriptional regulator [Streptomyces sp. Z26]|uniref:GntR family transcriptional regulator n=1 Tax=Streptomyces sp. Z26 TaxID=2500177 RepID=UPI000EF135FC|nr:GntR family transcriptional regulator [Streptomyces sp. Z26]RLL67014.1 GntR family transcriptional regulator [Streptomyces sp. Z26]
MPKIYEVIANDLRTQINTGELRPGDRLPSAADLRAQYGGARATIRRAIDELVAERLVTSTQGRAPIVRERPKLALRQTGATYRNRQATGKSNFNAEVEAQGRRPRQKILDVLEVPAADDIAHLLGVEPGSNVLLRRRLFLIDDEPAQLVDGYYDPELVSGTRIAEARPIRGGVQGVIEDPEGPIRRRVVQFVEEIDIRMPNPHEKQSLDIPVGVPLARVLRTAYDTVGLPVEVLDSRIPADRHTFRYEIAV